MTGKAFKMAFETGSEWVSSEQMEKSISTILRRINPHSECIWCERWGFSFCFEIYGSIKVVIRRASTAFDWIILCLYVRMTIATTKWNLSTLPFVFGCSFEYVCVCVRVPLLHLSALRTKFNSKSQIWHIFCSIHRIKFEKNEGRIYAQSFRAIWNCVPQTLMPQRPQCAMWKWSINRCNYAVVRRRHKQRLNITPQPEAFIVPHNKSCVQSHAAHF